MAIKPVSGEIKAQVINDNLSYLESKTNQINGGPIGSVGSVSELNSKFPNGANGFFIISGEMYFWEDGAWVNRGIYQAVGIAENSIEMTKYQNKSIPPAKTTFAKTGINLLDPSLIVDDYVWLFDARSATPNTNYSYIGKIQLRNGQSLVFSDENGLIDMRYVTAWDYAGNLVASEGAQNVKTFTAGPSTYYVTVSFLKTYRQKNIMLRYGTNFNKFEKFKIDLAEDVVLSKKMQSEITDKLIDSYYIQKSISEPVNIINELMYMPNMYIEGYNVNGENGPAVRNSATDSIYKYAYPLSRTGIIRVYYSKATAGQQVFLTDKLDKYITMSNITNFPNLIRQGWYINVSESYFEIDVSKVVDSECHLYFVLPNRDREDAYFKVDGREYFKETVLSGSNVELIAPRMYPIVAGDTGYIYFDAMLLGDATKSFYNGTSMWSNNNNKSAGNTVLSNFSSSTTKTIFARDGLNLISKSVLAHLVPKSAGEGTTKKVMIIGESTTDTAKSTFYIPALKGKFENDGMNIELVGTRGEAGFKHEGRSGWGVGALRYLASRIEGNVDNPFYNPVKDDFDFAHYCTSNPSASNVDIVIIRFGINEPNRFVENKTSATFIEHYNYIINDIKKTSPDCKFILDVTMSIARFPSAFPSTNRETIMQRNKALIDEFDNRENEGVYVSCSFLNVDPIYDYPLVEEPVNIYSTIKQLETTDNTHPAEPGQRKQADISYWMIKYISSV